MEILIRNTKVTHNVFVIKIHTVSSCEKVKKTKQKVNQKRKTTKAESKFYVHIDFFSTYNKYIKCHYI